MSATCSANEFDEQRGESLTSVAYVNPLATRFVSPGRLPWLARSEDDSIGNLVSRLETLGRRVQILGAHGSGKSTCLEHLVPKLGRVWLQETPSANGNVSPHNLDLPKADSAAVVWFGLRRGSTVNRSFVRFLNSTQHFAGILVVDGLEQLNWWQRWRLLHWTKRRSCGLVATTHRDMGLPTLLRTEPTVALLQEVVREAWAIAGRHGQTPPQPAAYDWSAVFQRHAGDLRECLMELYDLAELDMRKVVRAWPQN